MTTDDMLRSIVTMAELRRALLHMISAERQQRQLARARGDYPRALRHGTRAVALFDVVRVIRGLAPRRSRRYHAAMAAISRQH